MSSKDTLLSGEIEADGSYFGGRRKGKRRRGSRNKVPVFGILAVKLKLIEGVKAETLLKERVKKVKRESFNIYRQV